MTRNLTVHFKRSAYLVTPGPDTTALAGKPVRVHEWEDGRVEIRCNGQTLPFTVFDKNPQVTQGAVVESKRLNAVLPFIQAGQAQRDSWQKTGHFYLALTIHQESDFRAVPVLPADRAA